MNRQLSRDWHQSTPSQHGPRATCVALVRNGDIKHRINLGDFALCTLEHVSVPAASRDRRLEAQWHMLVRLGLAIPYRP